MEKRNSLLIVDDDTSNLMELIHILQPEYKIFTAKDGAAAIRKAESSLPDLILLDIVMPDMSGFEVLAKLKASELTKGIPVIIISGLGKSGNEDKGLALGAVDYINKPFDEIVVRLRTQNQIQIVNLQRELEAAVREAEAANQAKSAFLANINHEIRTPMNAIVALTELQLEEDDPANGVMDYLEKISTAGNTLMGIINDVLDFSKIESGKYELTPVRYETEVLLNDIITLNIMRIGDKPVVFRLEVVDKLFKTLCGDDIYVKQILNNLLSNAFKYTKAGTVTLSVNCAREGEDEVRLTFSVTDTGIGVRKEDLERVFSEYEQADVLLNRSVEGTGLGLSLARRLAELMGGGISVESEYGVGSTFSATVLQGFDSEELVSRDMIENLQNFSYSEMKRKAANKFERSDFRQTKVLVVDDFSTNLEVAKRMFAKYQIEVDCLESGEEALNRISAGEPSYDMIFMDHMMPGMDGVETVRRIRKIGTKYAESVTIIALTANAVAGNESMFIENGFQAFLSKPLSVAKLDAVLHKWIDREARHPVTADSGPKPETVEATPKNGKIAIPGINEKLGLSLYGGDVEMFVEILRSFVECIPDELEKLRNLSEDTLREYSIDVHTVKGAAASIGAKELSEWAAKLESQGKSGDISGVQAENDSLLISAYTLVEDITAWLATV